MHAEPRSERIRDKSERTFITPEGVDLRLHIGDAGQRVGAFVIDAVIIILVLIAMVLAAIFTGATLHAVGGNGGLEMAFAAWLLVFFLLRNFYFTAFELTPAAATPGKRLVGLRVASRDGGQLKAQSVFTRNVMRELELFMPISLIFADVSGGGSNGWVYLLGVVWAAIFLFFPLFNKDRLRLGDLVGGTWVVRTPKRKLSRDMADEGTHQMARYSFTTQQLDAYGAKELHVLEDVLRSNNLQTQNMVAHRIMNKIGWQAPYDQNNRDFLSAYYTALRGHLEKKLLLGVRRRDKYDV